MSMNPRKKDQLIYIRTNYTGFIPELGTAGPIVSPMLCPISRCVKMMSNGVKLFEVDPKSGRTIALTLSNIDSPNNFGEAVDAAPEKFNVSNPVNVQVQEPVVPVTEPPVAPVEEPVEEQIEEEEEEEDEEPTQEPPKTEDVPPVVTPKMTKAQKKAARAAAAAANQTAE